MDAPASRTAARWLGALVVMIAAAPLLSGCFMIPLLDGRSPFDDPFGASRSDVEQVLPAVQAAVDGLGLSTEFQVDVGSDDCEGACQLGPRVRFASERDSDDEAVDAACLAAVVGAALDAAPSMLLRVTVGGASLEDAAVTVFGEDVTADDEELTIAPKAADPAAAAARAYLQDEPLVPGASCFVPTP